MIFAIHTNRHTSSGPAPSPLRDLVLEQRLAVLQGKAWQIQEVHAPSLSPDAEQLTRPQQEEDCHPSGTEEDRRTGMMDRWVWSENTARNLGLGRPWQYTVSILYRFHDMKLDIV